MRTYKEERAALKAARQRLAEIPAAQEVTPEYLAANRAVIDAERALPWWLRG